MTCQVSMSNVSVGCQCQVTTQLVILVNHISYYNKQSTNSYRVGPTSSVWAICPLARGSNSAVGGLEAMLPNDTTDFSFYETSLNLQKSRGIRTHITRFIKFINSRSLYKTHHFHF